MVQEACVGESDQLSADQKPARVEGSPGIFEPILQPGQYLVELEAIQGTTLDTETLTRGLALMGWSKICPDSSEPGLIRFVGELECAISISDSPVLRWTRVSQVSNLDVFGELEYRLKPLEVSPGNVYELLFIARTKSHRTRADVKKALEDMGFIVDVLSLLKRDMRVPGYPGASAGLWFAFATWKGPESYVNADDAFVFEAVEEARQPAQVLKEETKG